MCNPAPRCCVAAALRAGAPPCSCTDGAIGPRAAELPAGAFVARRRRRWWTAPFTTSWKGPSPPALSKDLHGRSRGDTVRKPGAVAAKHRQRFFSVRPVSSRYTHLTLPYSPLEGADAGVGLILSPSTHTQTLSNTPAPSSASRHPWMEKQIARARCRGMNQGMNPPSSGSIGPDDCATATGCGERALRQMRPVPAPIRGPPLPAEHRSRSASMCPPLQLQPGRGHPAGDWCASLCDLCLRLILSRGRIVGNDGGRWRLLWQRLRWRRLRWRRLLWRRRVPSSAQSRPDSSVWL